ncbi:bacterial extracellular solute-binding s, 5 Middle family protein, partial [Chlamydia psittaci 06-1683]
NKITNKMGECPIQTYPENSTFKR